MSHNSFGHLFRVTTWGESHGPAIGCVVDGTPPRIPLTAKDIQRYLDKRRPGTSRFTSQRQEPDAVHILSGIYEEKGMSLTTGTPISLLIKNTDQRPQDYDALKDVFRPGHADYTYWKKYGVRDPRGGGRASARETATRVAAGAIARKVSKARVRGALVQIGNRPINRQAWDWKETQRNPFWCPDPKTAKLWEKDLEKARTHGTSLGAVVEIVADRVPVGLGAPLYGKMDADIAAALMSINAVKGVEIGAGFSGVTRDPDEMRMKGRQAVFLSNDSGGVLGGITTGQPVVARFAVKPTSSVRTPRRTITRSGKEAEVITKGRHDPCVGIRAVPVGEAMVACVLADHVLRHRAQTG